MLLERAEEKALETLVHEDMARSGSQGLALAFIDHGKVRLVKTWGIRNIRRDPLTPSTIMYGASLTKTVFAYLVMQLVQEKRLSLDSSIADYLPRPLPEYANEEAYAPWEHLAGDERWRKITPRIMLTHSTGFANFHFLEPDGKLKIHFEPGTRYAYSGAGIMLLQFVIERGLGLNLGKELQARVFGPLKMANTSLVWRPEFAANLADGWTEKGEVEPHDQRSRVRAAGSMDTTIEDMARFAAALVTGKGLEKKGLQEMTRPGLPIRTASQFPTFLPELPSQEQHPKLSAGLGVVVFEGPQGAGFYKGGHNDSTGNTMVFLPRGQRAVVLLSNDVRSEQLYPSLVKHLLGPTRAPWSWEYGPLPWTKE
ncbi:MAG: serine hydrolase domain-containing protein [Armatimonas sp.]